MNKPTQNLLIISRDALLDEMQRGKDDLAVKASAERLFRSLAKLSRQGYQVLLTAAEPERWVPTRGTVDDALNRQNALLKGVRDAGGEIDGIYYVPRSLFTQDRNREGALRDILKRYSLGPAEAHLISSSVPFVKAAARLGIPVFEIAPPGKRGKKLDSVLKGFAAPR